MPAKTTCRAVALQITLTPEYNSCDISRILKALRGSAEEKVLLQRYTRQLDDQETQLDALRKKIQDTEARRDTANDQLQKIINDLKMESTL